MSFESTGRSSPNYRGMTLDPPFVEFAFGQLWRRMKGRLLDSGRWVVAVLDLRSMQSTLLAAGGGGVADRVIIGSHRCCDLIVHHPHVQHRKLAVFLGADAQHLRVFELEPSPWQLPQGSDAPLPNAERKAPAFVHAADGHTSLGVRIGDLVVWVLAPAAASWPDSPSRAWAEARRGAACQLQRRARLGVDWADLDEPRSAAPAPGIVGVLRSSQPSFMQLVTTTMLDHGVLLGRSELCLGPADVLRLSREHACLLRSDGKLWLFDLGSALGTTLDGVPVRCQPLPPQATLTLANWKLRWGAMAPQTAGGHSRGDAELILLTARVEDF